MSMQPKPWPEVPAVTAQVAKRAFRKQGSLPIRIRDELGAWYADGEFAGGDPVRGEPGISPAQLAMVTVLQFTEDLTDRQAADAVRGRVDWKYCLGLELADPGFEFTVLNGFRDRLLAGAAERVIFDALLARLRELGLVGAGGRAGTAATHGPGWIRQYYRDISADGEKVIWREAGEHGLPPGRDRIVSPYDLDARYSEKHGRGWIGYKIYLSESISGPAAGDPQAGRPQRPQVITNVDTTRAAVADVAMTTPVHDQMQASGVTPGEHVEIGRAHV